MGESLALTMGVRNLLLNCASATSGSRVLLLSEESELQYCDQAALDATVQMCKNLDVDVENLVIPFCAENPAIPTEVQEKIEQSNIVICFSRLIDQLRFQNFLNCQKCVVNYAATAERLSSPFGYGDYNGFLEIKKCVENLIENTHEIKVTCQRGTNFSGPGNRLGRPVDDVQITRFPMLIFTPVLAAEFSGIVALPRFLIGTSRNFYQPYGLNFKNVLYVIFKDGRLSSFDGDPEDVALANCHLDTISQRYGLDREYVHSWHAGIHPANEFQVSVFDNPELWCNSAFGNPRILHFHTCGQVPPGEISWNVLDPTIIMDGTPIWEMGQLHLDRIKGGASILEKYPDIRNIFRYPRTDIGLRI